MNYEDKISLLAEYLKAPGPTMPLPGRVSVRKAVFRISAARVPDCGKKSIR